MRAEDFATKGPRHHFPLGVVAGSLALVLQTGTHLKRVAAVLALTVTAVLTRAFFLINGPLIELESQLVRGPASGLQGP